MEVAIDTHCALLPTDEYAYEHDKGIYLSRLYPSPGIYYGY